MHSLHRRRSRAAAVACTEREQEVSRPFFFLERGGFRARVRGARYYVRRGAASARREQKNGARVRGLGFLCRGI